MGGATVEAMDAAIGGLTVGPDVTNVYPGNVAEDSVSVFARAPGSGRLSFVEEIAAAGRVCIGDEPARDGLAGRAVGETS